MDSRAGKEMRSVANRTKSTHGDFAVHGQDRFAGWPEGKAQNVILEALGSKSPGWKRPAWMDHLEHEFVRVQDSEYFPAYHWETIFIANPYDTQAWSERFMSDMQLLGAKDFQVSIADHSPYNPPATQVRIRAPYGNFAVLPEYGSNVSVHGGVAVAELPMRRISGELADLSLANKHELGRLAALYLQNLFPVVENGNRERHTRGLKIVGYYDANAGTFEKTAQEAAGEVLQGFMTLHLNQVIEARIHADSLDPQEESNLEALVKMRSLAQQPVARDVQAGLRDELLFQERFIPSHLLLTRGLSFCTPI